MLWEEFASFPRSWASCLPPVWPAVHCECIEDSRLSAVIGLRRSLWRPLAAAAEGAETHLPTSQSVSAGGVTRRSTPGQVCGLALLTRLTCPHLDGRPLQQSAASALPEGSHSASCQRKIPYRIFYSHYDYAYKSPPDCDYMPVHVGAFVGRAR